MIIYILAFLISIILIWISEHKIKSKKIKILLMVLAVVPLYIISAIRYDVGTDYIKRYTNNYITLSQGKDITNLEIGFKIIDYICIFFTKEPYLLFIVTSLMILAIIYETVYKKSTNRILSITIFFLGGYYFGSLNLVRQYVAIAFVFIGYQFLLSNHKVKAYIGFLVSCLIAFSMHSSSIICFCIMFLNRKILLNIKWVLPVSIIIFIFNEKIMNLLNPIIEKTRFAVYLNGAFAKGQVSILNLLENFIVYIWMYVIYIINKKRKNDLEKEGIILLNIQGIAFLMTIAGTIHMQFLRIAIYFWIFQVLSVPYYLSITPFEYIIGKINEKLKKNLKERTIKITVYVAFIMIFLAMFCYTNVLNNDNEVLPYKTIYAKDKN